ncbi:MAG: hypothetical protein KTR29_08740 [Rhodothermaceae bacterium]|nr:hypothetical protein [Rhodothermaceae bacterium]
MEKVPDLESGLPSVPLEEPDASVENQEVVEKKKKKKKKPSKKEGLGSSRGVETMFRTSYRTNMDLSALADAKANIMISINGIIISIIIASISPKIDSNPWLLIPTSVLLLSCMVSISMAVLAARPRLNSKFIDLESVRSNKANILFFGNFVNMREDDFIIGMKELVQDNDRLYVNMMRDIYGLGTVLEKKFRFLRTSYNVFMVGLIIGVILFIGIYAWVVLGVNNGSMLP